MVLNQSATTTQKQTSTARAMPQTLRLGGIDFQRRRKPPERNTWAFEKQATFLNNKAPAYTISILYLLAIS